MASYPGIYRAKAVKLEGTSLAAYIPQVFGDMSVVVENFTGTPPTGSEMGWVSFQGGNPEFPVWLSPGGGTTGGDGTGGGESGVGPTGPTGPAGVGVPEGGTANQVLAKIDSANYNTRWVAQTGGVSTSRRVDTTLPLTGGGDLSADRNLAITAFAGAAPGAVPTSPGGSVNFLRADGQWALPPGAGGGISGITVKEGATILGSAFTALQFVAAGFDVSGSTEAIITLDLAEYAGTALPIIGGGTGATTAAGALTALGAANATTLSTHLAATTSVHGIVDTAALATRSGVEVLTNKTIDLANNQVTGSVEHFNTALAAADFYTTGGIDSAVADGGTGRSSSVTAFGIIAAGITATGPHQTIGPGVAGQFLKSAGPDALGYFATMTQTDVSGLSAALLAKADKTTTITAATPITGGGTLGASNISIGINIASTLVVGATRLATPEEAVSTTPVDTIAVTPAGLASGYLKLSGGTISPGNLSILSGNLNFSTHLGQHLLLYGTTYGIGVQASTLYQRTGAGFAWYLGGVHSDTQWTPGTGGTELLRLDTSVFLYKGSKIWHEGNDGAASLLDADLLDGQQGSFYQNATNLNLGTVHTDRLTGTYFISVTGNAGTATTLQNTRYIAGFPFNGSTNITLATLSRGQYLLGANYNGAVSTTWDVDASIVPTGNKVVARDAAGDIFASKVTGTQFVSALPGPTPPLTVVSQGLVTNLNSDLLDGNHADYFTPIELVEYLMGDIFYAGLYSPANYDNTDDTTKAATKPQTIYGPNTYRHGMYWVANSSAILDFIDTDLSGRYDPTGDGTVPVFNGDWIVAIDPKNSYIGTVVSKSLTANVATLTLLVVPPLEEHPLEGHPTLGGDVVTITGVDATFNGTYTLTAATATTISYNRTAGNVATISSGGSVAVQGHDTGTNHALDEMTFQYIPFSAETYVKSEIADHRAEIDPHPAAGYLKTVAADLIYAPKFHHHPEDYAEIIALHTDSTRTPDPHGQYLTVARGELYFLPIDTNFDNDILAFIEDHKREANPHSQYLDQEEGDGRYEPKGLLATHVAALDPHSQYMTTSEGQMLFEDKNAVAVHEQKTDPHVIAGYLNVTRGDLRYAKETHHHNDLYYTKSEVTDIFSNIDDEVLSSDNAPSARIFIGQKPLSPVLGDVVIRTTDVNAQPPGAPAIFTYVTETY